MRANIPGVVFAIIACCLCSTCLESSRAHQVILRAGEPYPAERGPCRAQHCRRLLEGKFGLSRATNGAAERLHIYLDSARLKDADEFFLVVRITDKSRKTETEYHYVRGKRVARYGNEKELVRLAHVISPEIAGRMELRITAYEFRRFKHTLSCGLTPGFRTARYTAEYHRLVMRTVFGKEWHDLLGRDNGQLERLLIGAEERGIARKLLEGTLSLDARAPSGSTSPLSPGDFVMFPKVAAQSERYFRRTRFAWSGPEPWYFLPAAILFDAIALPAIAGIHLWDVLAAKNTRKFMLGRGPGHGVLYNSRPLLYSSSCRPNKKESLFRGRNWLTLRILPNKAPDLSKRKTNFCLPVIVRAPTDDSNP